MRKYIKYNIIGLILMAIGIMACDTASQDPSPIVPPNDTYPVVTYTLETTNTTFNEGDTVLLYTVSIDKAVQSSLNFQATLTGGTVTGDDYEIVSAIIPAWENEATLSIIFLEDFEVEVDETLDFEIGLTSVATKYMLHPDYPQTTNISLTVANTESDVLKIYCDWEADITINTNDPWHPEDTYIEHASSVDFDMEVYYNDTMLVAGAWTGDCPEVLEINESDMLNGTYYVYSFLWANPFAHFDTDYAPETITNIDLPFTSTYVQQSVFNEVVYKQDVAVANVSNTADLDYDNDAVVDYRVVSIFTYTDGVISIIADDGSSLGGAKAHSKREIHKK